MTFFIVRILIKIKIEKINNKMRKNEEVDLLVPNS